jgi:hypothetical protein
MSGIHSIVSGNAQRTLHNSLPDARCLQAPADELRNPLADQELDCQQETSD